MDGERWDGGYSRIGPTAAARAWCVDRPLRPTGRLSAQYDRPVPWWIGGTVRAAHPTGRMLLIRATGWPWPSLAVVDYARTGTYQWHAALGLQPGGLARPLPLIVLWPGFLGSSAVYGSALTGATLAAWGARARRRRRRGLCITCGYAREGLPAADPCPECGAAPA